MPTVTVPAGTLHYRVAGPDDPTAPPVVFVHGFLVDSRLWDRVAERLAAEGVRSYLVDWPLGSHATPMGPDADLSPLGVARLVNEVIDALGLRDVTLVGNDTGGAICQLLLADDASRVGRVVLTNCDAFENFPPRLFVPLFLAAKHTWLTALLLAPMRFRLVRSSPLAYGTLMRPPRDNALTRHWITPALADRRIRADIARFTRGVDRGALVDAAPRLRDVTAPARIVWGTDDRNFTLETGRRLAAAFADGELIEVPNVSTFVSVDEPDAVAAAILGRPVGAQSGGDGAAATGHEASVS
jgi:pimeloyl-ACP methyl ester carboxylesterase